MEENFNSEIEKIESNEIFSKEYKRKKLLFG